jgi:hypothetical protein
VLNLVILALLACTDGGDSKAPADDTGKPSPEPPACPEVEAPDLAADTWIPAGPLPAMALHSFATDGGAPVWISSHNAGMWRADEDLSWSYVRQGITHINAELALRPGDPEHLVRSAGGLAERTPDGGVTWEALPLGGITGDADDLVNALAYTSWSPDRIIGVLRGGGAYVSEDDGDSWTLMGYAPIHEAPLVEDPWYVWGWRVLPEAAEGGRVVFGDGFGVAVSDDGMATWTRTLDTEVGGFSLMRDPRDPRRILVGSPDGLLESTDEGSTWTLRDIGGDGTGGAWARDGSWLAIVGKYDVLVSEDGGESFVARAHPFHDPVGVSILDDGRLLVADHAGAWASDDRGATWTDVSAGLEDAGMSVVVADPLCPARVFAASRCGSGLYTSEDYGASWTPNRQYMHYVMGVHFSPANPTRAWAVTDDDVLRSDDGGATWAKAWSRYHFHGFASHPDDAERALLGSVGSGGWADETMRVYRTEDGGATWTDSSTGLPESEASAHAIHHWPGDPDVVLLGTYRGGDVSHLDGDGIGLYRSEDGGASWAQVGIDVTEIAGFAVVGDAVYAATSEGIWGSTDGGVGWSPASGPTGHVTAIAFGPAGTAAERVGLAFDRDGGGWRTDDGGATWAPLDAGLPGLRGETLAQVSISADGTVGYLAIVGYGVRRIGL